MKSRTFASVGVRVLRLLVWPSFVLITACSSNQIRVIDTSVPPVLSAEGDLVVTLNDGEQIDLPIYDGPAPETPKVECGADIYETIGSFTFVERTIDQETFGSPEEEAARRLELRNTIITRREFLKDDFLEKIRADEYGQIERRLLNCNLVLQPDDLIYVVLRFDGARSSGVSIGCLGDGDNRAQIRNPATTSMLKANDSDIAMLDFRPANCGVEPLTEGGDTYVDELGAIKSRCDPVRNVTITNCRIRGRVDTHALGGDLADLSMIRADHVQRLRESAPQHVTFNSVKIEGRYHSVIHLRPGAHHFTVRDSELLGAFIGITLHLPADGGWNVLRDSKVTGQRKRGRFPWSLVGKKREVISVDSSEHNRIVNNHILDMKYGAIKLYRNCGERGSIRHRVPQYNQFINNVFDYSEGGHSETLFVGSRDDKSIKWSFGYGVKGYCHKDQGEDGERFAGNDVPEVWDTEVVRNSSESNSDWAQHNLIADNQVINFRRDGFATLPQIKLSSKARSLGNFLIGNEFTTERSTQEALRIQRSRQAGCAVLAGVTDGMPLPHRPVVRNGAQPYLRHNDVEKYFWDIRPRVQLACGTPLVCRDNMLIATQAETCVEPVVFDYGSEGEPCTAANNVCVEGSNDGDEHRLGCANLLGVQAACNLEFGRVSDRDRDTTLLNRVRVVRPSDKKSKGRCTVDDTTVKEGRALIQPWLFQRYEGSGSRPSSLDHACKEHDRNGGDCHMNVRHYCGPTPPIE